MIFNTLVSLSLLATAFAVSPQPPSQPQSGIHRRAMPINPQLAQSGIHRRASPAVPAYPQMAQSGIHRRASPVSPAYPQMAQSGIHRRAVPAYPQSAQSGIHRRCDGFGGWGGFGGCGFFPFIVQDFNAVNDNSFCVNDFNRNTEAAVFCDSINDFNLFDNNFNAVNENLIVA